MLGIWLEKIEQGEELEYAEDGDSKHFEHRKTKGDPVSRTDKGQKYVVVTREYMATGHDGYEPLKGSKYHVDDENGLLMSTIVRKFLLGGSKACYSTR